MNNQHIFKFTTDISSVGMPEQLNNPFALDTPEIVRVAVKEFQDFLSIESQRWAFDLQVEKGKMYGVLVVQQADGSYVYLGTNSGKLPRNATCDQFIPSVFDDSTDDYFINRGMAELSEIGSRIKATTNQCEREELTEIRKQRSFAIQQQLFESYLFLNLHGSVKNVLQIFKHSSHGNPPAAAGECAAPKLLQYALKHQLKPIAIAEFWWGKPSKNKERAHKNFYPACKDKCRPILEYMLCNAELFNKASALHACV